MAKVDPERERRRLAEFYAGQMNGELEKLAGEAYELSDLARGVLKAEFEKRGLGAQLTDHPPALGKNAPKPGDPAEEEFSELALREPEVTPPTDHGDNDSQEVGRRDLVTVRKFRDLPEALLAKGSLNSAGIECALADDNMVRMDWFYSNAIGGVKLLVNAGDAGEAEQILSQPIPDHLDVTDVGDFEQPKCPKCGSLDVSFRKSQPAAYVSMALNVPLPFRERAWHCHSCNVEWEGDGVPGPAESATS